MNKHIAMNMVRDYGVIAHDHPATDEPVLTEMFDRWKNGSEAKANRWLGFVQGAMFARGVFTLEDLKNHSRRHCVLDGIGGIAFHNDGAYWAQFPPLRCVTRGTTVMDAANQAVHLLKNAIGDGGLGLRAEPMAEDGPVTHVRIWALGAVADDLLDRVLARRLTTDRGDEWETQITKKRPKPKIKDAHLMDQAISLAEGYRYHVDWLDSEGEHVGFCEEYPSLSFRADTIAAARFGIFEQVTQVVHDQMLAGDEPAKPVRGPL